MFFIAILFRWAISFNISWQSIVNSLLYISATGSVRHPLEHGKWSTSVEEIEKRVSKHLNMLRKLKFSRQNLEKIIFGLYSTNF